MNRKISPEKHKLILKLFKNKFSSIVIGRKLHLSDSTIMRHLKKYHIYKRPKGFYRNYKLNESFFDKPEEWTEEQSYLFGFIMGDGHNNIKQKVIQIQLAERDKEHLEKINSLIQSKKIRFINKETYRQKYKSKTQDAYLMSIFSSKISKQLLRLGIDNNKTLKCHIPTFLNKKNMRHFIRGLIDADGCFYTSLKNKKVIVFSFSGNKTLTKELFSFLKKELSLKGGFFYKDKRSKINCPFSFGSVQDVYKIYKYLYKNSNIFLLRKRKKCEDFFN